MKKTQVTDKNTQKPRRHQKNPDLVEKTQLWQHWRRTNRRINHGTGFLISVSCKVKASAGGSVVTHSSGKFASGLKHCRFSNAFSVSVSVYTVVGLLDLSEI